jgi:predicted CXXCH cytochrome family protein
MHASQNGTLMGDGPNNYLLLYTCINCHSGPTGQATTANGAPIVLRTSGGAPGGQGGTFTLAGGDFYWVDQGSDALGHNVDVIVGPDAAISANIGNNPPGWDNSYNVDAFGADVANSDANWTVQLTCAGTYGCHGDHSVSGNDAGIVGAHHGNTGGTTTQASSPTTVGGSFRFCAGINGLEDATWNWAETNAAHNEYFGTTYNDAGGAPAGDDLRTMSYLCALCHGTFHEGAQIGGATTPWLRHPTDIVLMSGSRGTTEYSAYNQAGAPPAATYSLEAPVARGAPVPAASTATVNTNQSDDDGAIVSCLSCHRAHGSDQPDILRWDYSTVIAGGGSSNVGCFKCHTTKDTP